MIEVDVREEQVPDIRDRDAVGREPGVERLERRGRSAVEERKAVVGVDEVDADRMWRSAEVQVDQSQRIHNPIFAVGTYRSVG